MPLSSHIHEIIEKKGLKKTWVAKQLGISPSYLGAWKNNKNGICEKPPAMIYLFMLARLLDCYVDDLMELIGEDEIDSNN
jgi:transcriptional regulator with XRE-family HTH domain